MLLKNVVFAFHFNARVILQMGCISTCLPLTYIPAKAEVKAKIIAIRNYIRLAHQQSLVALDLLLALEGDRIGRVTSNEILKRFQTVG